MWMSVRFEIFSARSKKTYGRKRVQTNLLEKRLMLLPRYSLEKTLPLMKSGKLQTLIMSLFMMINANACLSGPCWIAGNQMVKTLI